MQLIQTFVVLACAAYAAAGTVPQQGPCAECPSQVDTWTLSSSCYSPGGEKPNTVCSYTQGTTTAESVAGATGYCKYQFGLPWFNYVRRDGVSSGVGWNGRFSGSIHIALLIISMRQARDPAVTSASAGTQSTLLGQRTT
ncbi:hypothetical protein BU15DRAFT_63699 [Melanogaster broomeanus]|nr:hypothetical protein BU15DRAFT_63699 [Melanogaster broomeanus]